MNGFIWHSCLWYQQTGLSVLKVIFQPVVPQGPWKVGQDLKHSLIPSMFYLSVSRTNYFWINQSLISSHLRFASYFLSAPVDSCGSVQQGKSWIDINSAVMVIYVGESKSYRKCTLFLMIFKAIPKSIAGRHSLSVLASSETGQLVDHFSPVAHRCLGTVFREATGPSSMRELANSWLEDCDKFFLLWILLLGTYNETWLSIPWCFAPCMRP